MSLEVSLPKYELYQEYPLIEMGHTIQPPPPGALVRVSIDAGGQWKYTTYVVATKFRTSDDQTRRVEMFGADVFDHLDKILKEGRGFLPKPKFLNRPYVDTIASIKFPNTIQTIAILAEDFFRYLETVNQPLEQQFPRGEGFSSPHILNRARMNPSHPSYKLSTTYDLDDFVIHSQWPLRGALIETEQTLESGSTRKKRLVFEKLEFLSIRRKSSRVINSFVYGLDIDNPTDAKHLTVCEEHFRGRKMAYSNNSRTLSEEAPLPCKITILAENYFAKPEGATPSQEPTDIKTESN